VSKRRLSKQQQVRIRALQTERRARAGHHRSSADAEGELGAERHGTVVINQRAAALVEDAEGGLHQCKVRQNLGGLACGDRVVWQPADSGGGVVIAVEPRRSLLERPGFDGRPKAVAANLDQIVVVAAARPAPSLSLIDRYLVAAELSGIKPVVLLNKIDLLDSAALEALRARLATFETLGYPVLLASTHSEHGLDAVRARLAGHTSILAGQSGVGKSSLVKALLPDLEIRIGAVSEATGHGRHTTTASVLYHLPHGGELIDSPGVRDFGLGHVAAERIIEGFPELQQLASACRFSDCAHTVEPGCALRAAAAQGEIDPRRLASFLAIRDELAAGSH